MALEASSAARAVSSGRCYSAIPEPNAYTSGFWLHRNSAQQKARHVNFDFEALTREVLVSCPESTNIVSIEKREGGYNKVFLFTMANGNTMVARLPTRIAGPSKLTTNSEVATVEYVRRHTSIPVPEVVAWSDTKSNPVGAEYILMKAVNGVPLIDRWGSMTAGEQIELIRSVGVVMKQLGSLSFPAYGSLYFHDAPLAEYTRIPVDESFVLGPHVGATYWDCSVGEKKHFHFRAPNRGPWKHLEEYLSGVTDSGYSYLPLDNRNDDEERLPYLGTVEENLELLKVCEKITQTLSVHGVLQQSSTPMLWHPDMHLRNIFVAASDPTQITAVIDWQSAAVEPAFMFAVGEPDFAETLDDAAGSPNAADDTAQSSKRSRNAMLRNRAYHLLASITPKLRDAMTLDTSISRVLTFSNMGWRSGAAMLRDELADLAAKWTELGLPGACPYALDKEQAARQKELFADFTTAQELRASLARAFHGDASGWVPAADWDAAREKHGRLFRNWMDTATRGEGKMSVEKAMRLWPWDPC